MATYKMIEIDKIKFAPFNPQDRTQKSKLKHIADSMNNVGQIYPILVDHNMNLIDGHRRVTAALSLGWTQIEAKIVDLAHQDTYVAVNETHMAFSGRQWVQTAHLGLPTDLVAPKHRRLLNLARQWLGEDAITLLAENDKSTDVIRNAVAVARYIDAENDDRMCGKILKWLIEQKTTLVANRFIRDNQPSEILEEAITSNRPLSFGYAIV
jgi:hypothetical protein